jgi:hypothetical protein
VLMQHNDVNHRPETITVLKVPLERFVLYNRIEWKFIRSHGQHSRADHPHARIRWLVYSVMPGSP